ncbi:hypothetical protein ACFVXH_21230 [Kitasatospora sp. NPDC058184]|uniref:hypothetical protein n=1 Tax=Kitasatospora sp. NPDC058184 TaxID=3346370 RepID=UPI0036D9ACF6
MRVLATAFSPMPRIAADPLAGPVLLPGTTLTSGVCGPARPVPADHDRFGAFLTVSWAALNVVALGVLGLLVHHAETHLEGAVPTSAPDWFVEDGRR